MDFKQFKQMFINVGTLSCIILICIFAAIRDYLGINIAVAFEIGMVLAVLCGIFMKMLVESRLIEKDRVSYYELSRSLFDKMWSDAYIDHIVGRVIIKINENKNLDLTIKKYPKK